MLSKKIPSIKIVVQLILSHIIWNLSFRHVNDECGIFLYFVHTYIAASPDFLISCSCCGDGCVEIKCPLITKCNTCSSFCTCQTSIYLIDKSWKLSLKINNSYFAQVQGQMYVTGRKWCDFFVCTCNGTFTERICYNDAYFPDILKSH